MQYADVLEEEARISRAEQVRLTSPTCHIWQVLFTSHLPHVRCASPTCLIRQEEIEPRAVSAMYDGGLSEEGQAEGQGVCHYADGSVYTGEWRGGRRDGR